jgi:uncharacterized membrane protein YozB (DUF420 family)
VITHPALNASLNAAAAFLLLLGYVFIRRKAVAEHRACMLAAFACSVTFFASYLVYHYRVGSVPFQGQGWVRTLYFAILISHTVLAAAVPPLAMITLARGLRMRVEKHRRMARWTLPIWLYVSITGVVIYFMLYRLQG